MVTPNTHTGNFTTIIHINKLLWRENNAHILNNWRNNIFNRDVADASRFVSQKKVRLSYYATT